MGTYSSSTTSSGSSSTTSYSSGSTITTSSGFTSSGSISSSSGSISSGFTTSTSNAFLSGLFSSISSSLANSLNNEKSSEFSTASSTTSSGSSSTTSYSGGSTITTSSGFTSSGSISSSSGSISSGFISGGFGNSYSKDFSEGSSSLGGFCYDWITYRGFTVYDPLLIILCIWALYIGISKHRLFKKFNDTYIYSITFLMYGIMMTFALLSDSLSNNFSESLKLFVGIADVDLTSTVGTFFLYCGLSDMGILDPKSFKGKVIMLFNSIILLISWTYTYKYVPSSEQGKWNFVLYEVVVGVSCGIYLILQIIYLSKNNRLKQIIWLLAGGLTGAIGLSITFLTHRWCEHFGARFSSSYAWFFLSDVAMLLIAKYVVSSRGNDELVKKYNKCCFSKDNDENDCQDDLESNIHSGIKYQPVVFIQQQQQQQPRGYILLHPPQQQQQFYFTK